MFSGKWLILTVGLITLFSFVLGIVTYDKRAYACYPDAADKYRWGDKVRVLNIGSLNFYASPYVKDCPEEDRYDPAQLEECGVYCRRTSL